MLVVDFSNELLCMYLLKRWFISSEYDGLSPKPLERSIHTWITIIDGEDFRGCCGLWPPVNEFLYSELKDTPKLNEFEQTFMV